jgi:hypothetical protein
MIILDTNAWVFKLRLLHSPMGLVLANYIKRKMYYIGIPDVIEKEVEKHIKVELEDRISFIKEKYREINDFTGLNYKFELPKPIDVEDCFRKELAYFDNEKIIHFPYDNEIAKQAYERVVQCFPPNSDKNQQYKDSIIWETIIKLSSEYDIVFISEDKAFFELKEYSKGLNKELRKSLDSEKRVELFSDVESFVKDKNDVIIELGKMIDGDSVINAIANELEENDYCLEIDKGFDYILNITEGYITENPDEIVFSYNAKLNGIYKTNEGTSLHAKYIVAGDGKFIISDSELVELNVLILTVTDVLERDDYYMSWKERNFGWTKKYPHRYKLL